jgi:CheY-like chemotaxis protein
MDLSTPHILIVEDEGIVAEDLRMLLKRLGYVVTGTCDSGEDAILAVTHMPPDLILMDINLAGRMDGIETAERIRSSLGIPIVFLTAYADGATLDRARNVAQYGYVMKPFESREIRLSIDIALHKHRDEHRDLIPEAGTAPDPSFIDKCRELRETIRQKDRLFGILSEDEGRPQNMLLRYCTSVIATAVSAENLPPAARTPSDDMEQHEDDAALDRYISLPTSHLSLREQISMTLDWLESRRHAKGVALRPDSTDEIILDANPHLFRYILRHSLLLALDRVPRDSAIELRSLARERHVTIEIVFPVTAEDPSCERPGYVTDRLHAMLREPTLVRCEQLARLQGGSYAIASQEDGRISLSFDIPVARAEDSPLPA